MAHLTFTFTRNGCCMLCNPPSLVDFEGPCVQVSSSVLADPDDPDYPLSFCAACLTAMLDVVTKRPKTPVTREIDPRIPTGTGTIIAVSPLLAETLPADTYYLARMCFAYPSIVRTRGVAVLDGKPRAMSAGWLCKVLESGPRKGKSLVCFDGSDGPYYAWLERDHITKERPV